MGFYFIASFERNLYHCRHFYIQQQTERRTAIPYNHQSLKPFATNHRLSTNDWHSVVEEVVEGDAGSDVTRIGAVGHPKDSMRLRKYELGFQIGDFFRDLEGEFGDMNGRSVAAAVSAEVAQGVERHDVDVKRGLWGVGVLAAQLSEMFQRSSYGTLQMTLAHEEP